MRNRFATLLVLLCISITVLPSLTFLTVAADGWLSGFGHRKSHTIIGSSAGFLSNYQMRVVVYKGTGSDNGENVYCEGYCRDDFGDVRFTDYTGVAELNYLIESYASGVSAIFWIKVGSIPVSPGTATIYIYYGKSDATTTSNGDDTFVFFDHFLGSSLNTNKWTRSDTGGTQTIADSIIRLQINTAGSTQSRGEGIESISSYNKPLAIRVREKATITSMGTWAFYNRIWLRSDASNYIFYYYKHAHADSGSDTRLQKAVSGQSTELAKTNVAWDESWHIFDVTHAAGGTVKVYRDGSQILSGSCTELSSGKLRWVANGYYTTDAGSGYIDWIAVRNFADPEPTHSQSWGLDEAKILSFTASGLPEYQSVSRTTYGKVWFDPFTSTATGSQYETVSASSFTIYTSGGKFSGEGYIRVYTGDSPNSGGTGQKCYARTQYATTISRGAVAFVYANFETDSGDKWVSLWYMGSGATGYKICGKTSSDSVAVLKQTGEGSYSTLSTGSSYGGGWSLILFTADSASVLRSYWKSINWETAPSDSSYSSGKIGFGGRNDYVRWSHFGIMSSRTLTFNGLQSGWTVDVYYGGTVAITGTASGSSLSLDSWAAMKTEKVPPYTKFVIRSGSTVLYDSQAAGQFVNDIFGGDVYSYDMVSNTVPLTVDGSPIGEVPPPYSKAYAGGTSSTFSVPASKDCSGTTYYFYAWKNSAGQTVSTNPTTTIADIQSSETYTAYYGQYVLVTSTATNFLYASSTARITSSTTTTALTSLSHTQTISTTTTTTAPQVTSTTLFPTVTYSTTYTTAPETSHTTRTTTTTTSYTGLSSTTTLLTTAEITTLTTDTSTATSYATTTTITATSLSTTRSTSATSTNAQTATATALTSTSYGYSTTTIGTHVVTTRTATIGTTTTITGNTMVVIYTERREVVTTYTESVRASRWDFGQLTIDVMLTETIKLVETVCKSFLASVEELVTDIIAFFETTVFGITEEVVVYEPIDVEITIDSSPQGEGFVKVDGDLYATPYTFIWKWGDIHQIEALSPVAGEPGTQYIFSSWSDDGEQLHEITVDTPQTIAANYRTQYYLTMQRAPLEGGSVAPDSQWYDAGTEVQIQATPNEGHQFTGWLGAGVGSYTGPANPQTIRMDGPITETAQFGEWRVTITFAQTGVDVSGTILTIDTQPYQLSDLPKSFDWIVGSSHSVSASTPIPAGEGKQYVFNSWTNGGGLSGPSGSYIVPMASQTVTVNYLTQYRLTIEVNNPTKGTTTPAQGQYWHNSGTSQPVTAQAFPGNQLNHWDLDGGNVGSSETYTVLMDSAHTLQAIFEASQVAVFIEPYPSDLQNWLKVDGVLQPGSTYSASWGQRSTHQIEAVTPIGGWHFNEWSGGGYSGSIQNPLSVQVSGDSWSIQAIYSTQYQLTVSTKPSGISPQPTVNPLGPWYDEGTVVTLTAHKVDGLEFRFWRVNGEPPPQGEQDGAMQITVYMWTNYEAVAHYMLEPGEVSQPSVTFHFTTPFVAPLAAILMLALAVALNKKRISRILQTIDRTF